MVEEKSSACDYMYLMLSSIRWLDFGSVGKESARELFKISLMQVAEVILWPDG